MELKLGTYSLLLLGSLLLGAGVVGGVMVERYWVLRCAVESKEFIARTVVCEDGHVYKLTQPETDDYRWEQLTKRVEAIESAFQPAVAEDAGTP